MKAFVLQGAMQLTEFNEISRKCFEHFQYLSLLLLSFTTARESSEIKSTNVYFKELDHGISKYSFLQTTGNSEK